MNKVEYWRQKDSMGSTGFAGSTGSHGFHGSKLVYTKSSWEFWVQLGMLGVALATGIWIKYWIVIALGFAGLLWLVGDRLSMPYDTIQITEEKIILLRKRHIYLEYLLKAQDRVTLKITGHFNENYHYYRLTMRLHNLSQGRGLGRKSTVIRFKHFVSSSHKGLQEDVQEIKLFLQNRANQQVTVRETFSVLHSW